MCSPPRSSQRVLRHSSRRTARRLRTTVEALLTASADATHALVDAVLHGGRDVITRGGERVDEASWILTIADAFPGDAGIVLSVLLNVVHLAPGQFIFSPAGQVHAYLSGTGVEIMANSDNVLRCGLTSKHVDRNEVMRVADFSTGPCGPGEPVRRPCGELGVDAAARDFALSRVTIEAGQEFQVSSAGAQIVLGIAGQLSLCADQHETTLYPGTAVFVPAGLDVRLHGTGDAFRAPPNSRLTPSNSD